MNTIDIIINAFWRGDPASTKAQQELRNLGNTVKQSTVEFAAASQRSSLLQSKLGDLGRQVALGSITVGDAQKQYNEYAATLTNVGQASQNTGLRLQNFVTKLTAVTVAIGAAALAAKTAFNALERGAGLELTTQRFDRLAESIGTTGDALRDDLGQATRGLISDAQQMALATDLLALGLATSSDQAVRLSRVVAELDQDVGELSLALVNQTTRRFDQLNVSAVGFEERLEALKEQGLDTQEAFTEAFLQQAEAQIDKVGGKAGTAAGELARMEAALVNVRDAAAGALLDAVRFMDGFEDIEDTTEAMNRLADAIEKVGDNFDKVLAIGRGLEFITDPIGNAADIWESIKDVQADLSSQLEDYLIQNEDWQNILDDVADTLRDIEELTGIEIIGDMERMVEEAESFDRALMNANNTLKEITEKLADAGIPGRGGFERGGDAGGRSGEQIRLTPGTITEQVQLFEGFQDDLTAISERAEQERASITEQYEQQRTDIVENYSRARAEEEADWLLRRSRQEEDFQRTLEDVRQAAAENEQEARSRSHQSIEDLERDHLERINDIMENADVQLKEAASRLNASAVARILRQRDSDLRDASDDYAEQRREIEVQLQRQLESIRSNMEQRLADLQEHHTEQQEREAEDRAIRLQRMEEAHRRELAELEDQYHQRMQDLKEQIRRERTETKAAYNDAYNKLILHHDYLETLTANYHERILQAEQDWWAAREALVGGDSGRGDPGTGGTGGGDGGGGDGGIPPGRPELNQIAIREMQLANWTESMIFSQLQQMHPWSDAQVARWIEDTFNYDVPGYKMGIDRVPQTGLALLHEDEAVLNPPEAARYRAGKLGGTINLTNNIYAAPGMDENALTRKVEKVTMRTIERVLEEVGA